MTERDSPARFLERFVAVEMRAACLIVAAALLGVGFATFGNVHVENDLTNVLSEIAIGGFFLLVGLELRREFASGVLSGLTLWASVAAATMGMALPALIYASRAPAAARDGWVAVVATDIALANVIMTLGGFSRKVRTLLLTVAVLDDLGGLIALVTTGKRPELLWLALAVAVVAIYASAIRQFNLGVVTVIASTVVVVALMLRAGLHPSLGAFAVGFCAPNVDPEKPSLSERVHERVHPWIAAIFLPVFVFIHTLVPIAAPSDVSTSLVWTTVVAIVLGKVLGVGGVLIMLSRRLNISVSESVGVGCAAAAALTVAIIGVAATLDDARYEQAVSLGILIATAIAFVLGVGAGRLTSNKGDFDGT